MYKYLKFSGWLAALVLTSFIAHTVVASSLPFGGITYYLAGAGINNSQNTVQLTSFKTPDGRLATMSMFGTKGYAAVDPQTSVKLEDISFTGITQNANGTATLTGVSRGLDFVYPYAASSTLAYSHSGGATFIVTNTAGFYYNEFAMPNNNNVTTWANASTSVASKGYVDFVAFNGAAVVAATTAVPGVSQLATNLQTASSTANNGAGYPLVIPAANATSTYNAQTAGLNVVVTQNNGKINPFFIFNATTTTPGNNGSASSTILENDGNGNWSWNLPHSYTLYSTTVGSSTVQTATTTLLTVPIPANTINGTSQVLRVSSFWASDSSTICYYGLAFGNGSASTTVGFAAGYNFSSLINYMVATSTASEGWTSDGTTMGSNGIGKVNATSLAGNFEFTMSTYPTVDLTAKSYLGFSAANSTSANCKLNGVTVEVVAQ